MWAIKHKTIAYISRLLTFLYFSKKLKKNCPGIYKNGRINQKRVQYYCKK